MNKMGSSRMTTHTGFLATSPMRPIGMSPAKAITQAASAPYSSGSMPPNGAELRLVGWDRGHSGDVLE
jgi:hypothetical protein